MILFQILILQTSSMPIFVRATKNLRRSLVNTSTRMAVRNSMVALVQLTKSTKDSLKRLLPYNYNTYDLPSSVVKRFIISFVDILGGISPDQQEFNSEYLILFILLIFCTNYQMLIRKGKLSMRPTQILFGLF